MNTLMVNVQIPYAKNVKVTSDSLNVDLSDGIRLVFDLG